jgi:hypothetical protein
MLLTPNTCARCGQPVVKRRRKHCDRCIPNVRADHARKVVESARKELEARRMQGSDPRVTPEANEKRALANAERHRQNRHWVPGESLLQRDNDWFRLNVLPLLDAVLLSDMSKATGLSQGACSRIRSGKAVPHPRHWSALAELVGVKALQCEQQHTV